MKKKIEALVERLSVKEERSEEERVHIQYTGALVIFSVVSFFMTFVNLLTDWNRLAMLTFAFGVCCAIDWLVENKGKSNKDIGRVLFVIEMIALFTTFVVVGEPEGFSPLWILLVPSCGFFLFRMKYGLIISAVQVLILMFLLWTPWGNGMLVYDYTETFMMRFPIVFIAFAGVGILFELVRIQSNLSLQKAKEKYEYMYNHDALTGLYNRYGFNKSLDDFVANRKSQKFVLAILDIDLFKDVNDRFGHVNGDLVLQTIANRIRGEVADNGIVCRWGGEEFSVLFYDSEEALNKLKRILKTSNDEPIDIEGQDVVKTLSIGMVVVEDETRVDISELIKQVDKKLYKAKNEGRNCIRFETYKK